MRAGIIFMTFLLLFSAICGPALAKNSPPVAKAGSDQKVKVGTTVRFGASDSYDPDGDHLAYSWDFDASNGIQVDSSMMAPTHVYNTPGIYKVTLTVFDGTYNSTANINVTVFVDTPPTVDLGPDINADVEQYIFFDTRNATDSDGDGLTYQWDFDIKDNITVDSTDSVVSWKYSKAGKYTVKLTANDGKYSANDTMNITVAYNLMMLIGTSMSDAKGLRGGQRTFYIIPLTKGKGLEVKISSTDKGELSSYLLTSANYQIFTQYGQIAALKAASKEKFKYFSYSISAPQADSYYLMVSNPSPDPNLIVNYTISIRTFNVKSGGIIPGPSAVDVISSLALVALAVVIVRKKP